MKIEKAIKILKHHNKWRRCEKVPNSLKMADPTELGKAIDRVVEYHTRKKK